MQSAQGLHCLLIKSLDTTECMNGEQRHEHVQDYLNLHILHMFEDTFSLDMAQINEIVAYTLISTISYRENLGMQRYLSCVYQCFLYLRGKQWAEPGDWTGK